MKIHTLLLVAAMLGASAAAANASSEKLGASRILAGGRNAPTIVTVNPSKQSLLAKRATVPRTEVLAGGRNAPHQVRPSADAVQVAPAVRK